MKYYKLTYDGAAHARSHSQAAEFLNIELTAHVDGERLGKAVNAALEYHPRYKTKLASRAGQYYLVPNDAPAVIRVSDDYDILEVDDYLWCCGYYGKRLTFAISAVLGNASGMMPLVRTVLRLYFGVETDVMPTEEQISAGSTEPVELVFARGLVKGGNAQNAPAVSLKEGRTFRRGFLLDEANDNYIYQFEFSSGLIGKVCTSINASAATVLVSIVSKALSKACGFSKGYIYTDIDVELGRAYGCYTETDFKTTARLQFDVPGYREQFFGYGAKYLQMQLNEFIRRDSLDSELLRMRAKGGLGRAGLAGIAGSLGDSFGSMFKGRGSKEVPVVIGYSHLGSTGISDELGEHIKTMYYSGHRSDREGIRVQVNDYKDRTYMRVIQSTTNDVLIRALEDELRDSKVPYKLNIFPGHPGVLFRGVEE